VGKLKRRSEKAKEKRRSRKKGPHVCPLCDHSPFKSISGLRAHVFGVHRKHCSWSKQISDLKTADVVEGPQSACARGRASLSSGECNSEAALRPTEAALRPH
jgi:hypothetical protein